MKRTAGIIFSILFGSAALAGGVHAAKPGNNGNGNGKGQDAALVEICHFQGKGGFIVIAVTEQAVDAHIALHGDLFHVDGECVEELPSEHPAE